MICNCIHSGQCFEIWIGNRIGKTSWFWLLYMLQQGGNGNGEQQYSVYWIAKVKSMTAVLRMTDFVWNYDFIKRETMIEIEK